MSEKLGRGDDARRAVDQSLQHNPLFTPAYYVELMAVLNDRPVVIEKRTSWLRSAGSTEAR